MISATKLRTLTDKVLIGGIERNHDFIGSKEQVKARLQKRVDAFVKQLPDGKFIIGGGCSIPIDADTDNVTLLRDVVDEYRR